MTRSGIQRLYPLVAIAMCSLLASGCGDTDTEPVAVAMDQGGGQNSFDAGDAPSSWILPPLSEEEIQRDDQEEPEPPDPVEPESIEAMSIRGLDGSLEAMGEEFRAGQATAYGPMTQIVSIEGPDYVGSLVVEELRYPLRPPVPAEEFDSNYQSDLNGLEVAVVSVEDAAVRVHVGSADGRLVTLNMFTSRDVAESIHGDLFEYAVSVASPLLRD